MAWLLSGRVKRAVEPVDGSRVHAGLIGGRGRRRAGDVHAVVELVEVAHVRAGLIGIAREADLRVHALEPRIHELMSVTGKRSVDHERGARAAVAVGRRLRAKGHAGGHSPGRKDSCDMCAYERHTYEHTTYDAI